MCFLWHQASSPALHAAYGAGTSLFNLMRAFLSLKSEKKKEGVNTSLFILRPSLAWPVTLKHSLGRLEEEALQTFQWYSMQHFPALAVRKVMCRHQVAFSFRLSSFDNFFSSVEAC